MASHVLIRCRDVDISRGNAVTVPSLLTVATVVFEDDHAACVVTLWLPLFDSVAVAANCAVVPTNGAVPLTATADAVTVELDGFVGAPDSCPQPLIETIIGKAAARWTSAVSQGTAGVRMFTS